MGQCCVNDNATKRQKKRKATVATNPLVAINALKSKKCITEGEVKAYVNAFFAKYDSNGDGFIDRQEVKAMLKDIASTKR